MQKKLADRARRRKLPYFLRFHGGHSPPYPPYSHHKTCKDVEDVSGSEHKAGSAQTFMGLPGFEEEDEKYYRTGKVKYK